MFEIGAQLGIHPSVQSKCFPVIVLAQCARLALGGGLPDFGTVCPGSDSFVGASCLRLCCDRSDPATQGVGHVGHAGVAFFCSTGTANFSCQRMRPVICMTTKRVRMAPMVTAKPVKPSKKKA